MNSPRALRILSSAAVAYTAAFVAGSVLSVRRGYTAEPLGIRTGLSPGGDVMVGNGAALAAPSSMIALLWQAVISARKPGERGRRARARLAVLGAVFLAGAVAEPVSHRLVARQLPTPDAVIAALNIVLPLVIVAGAMTSLVSTEPDRDLP